MANLFNGIVFDLPRSDDIQFFSTASTDDCFLAKRKNSRISVDSSKSGQCEYIFYVYIYRVKSGQGQVRSVLENDPSWNIQSTNYLMTLFGRVDVWIVCRASTVFSSICWPFHVVCLCFLFSITFCTTSSSMLFLFSFSSWLVCRRRYEHCARELWAHQQHIWWLFFHLVYAADALFS